MNLLAGLNPEQLKAVTWPNQSALILAGAGSGKTKVLTTRIAWLLQNHVAHADEILAVTFTNKAAKEMQARLQSMVNISTRHMWMGTFHGLCNKMLRLHHRDAGLPASFQILDQSEQLSAIKRLLKSLELSDEQFPPKSIQSFINHNKESGLRATQLPAPLSVYEEKKIALYDAYDKQCQREGVVDFAELLLRSYELLIKNEALRAHYQSRFRHILVDEFQDTNKLQYAWLGLLSGGHNAIFAVGDDDQSIYAFRGAEVGNMRSLLEDYQIQTPIRLEQNYRSVGNILNAANALIENNNGRLGKNLWTEAAEGEPIQLYRAGSDNEEAQFIVDTVKEWRRQGHDLTDMAVLYRSNAQSRVIEQALLSANLPYRIYGGLRFFDRQEVKHALAYLRLALNGDDDNAFLRIINVPARGIGAKSVESIQTTAKLQNSSLWQAACQLASQKPTSKLGAFVQLIIRMQSDLKDLSLGDKIDQIIEQSGLKTMYEADKKSGEERLENLSELVRAAFDFIGEGDADIVTEFLTMSTLEAGERQAGEGEDALQLMTVHAAKGLEFKTVFITGLEEGLFPHDNSRNDQKGLEEERRLMYVAMTRARQNLYLLHAESRFLNGVRHYSIRSCFVDEIPETLIHELNPKISNEYYACQANAPRMVLNDLKQVRHDGFRIGQTVEHAKFGLGMVINAEGQNGEVRLQINFADAGMKWLDLRYAKLKIIS